MTEYRVLVVDDSPTVLYKTAMMLGEGGYGVIKATDGQQALELARQEQPNLILLDVILPKLNGYQVCRVLKSIPDTAHIPVVMVTSKTKDRDRHWGIEQGADQYITKPFEADDLLDVIDTLLPQTT
jgi:twitching motility two-component system response regulator PilH